VCARKCGNVSPDDKTSSRRGTQRESGRDGRNFKKEEKGIGIRTKIKNKIKKYLLCVRESTLEQKNKKTEKQKNKKNKKNKKTEK